MKKIFILALISCFIATPVYAKDYVKAKDIQKVNLGATFEEVEDEIGDPQQVLSKELTPDGKQKVVWLYESLKRPKLTTTTGGGWKWDKNKSESSFLNEQQYQARRLIDPPYLIVFIDGKVSEITRLK